MPNLDEFINKNIESKQVPSTWEKLDRKMPCAHCEEDVDGGLWDPENLVMQWTCSSGHENSYRIN